MMLQRAGWTALLAASSALAASAATSTFKTGVEEPSAPPMLGTPVVQGCFSSQGELKFDSIQTFNSKSKCAIDICLAKGKPVAGTMGANQCFCGDKYPPKAALVNDSNCNAGCSGFDKEACGGSFFWTIYNTGLTLAVKYSDNNALSSSVSSSTTSTPTSTTSTTAPATTTAAPEKKKSGGSNTGGIVAGVVVAVVVIAAIVGGVFFFLRRRRNREIEEEHRRNAAVNAFISGSKPPGSSGGYSVTDSRLDPVMAHRRISNGSIADNEDYSRRILRVTNA
ncbi:hypothetical protein VTK73DRAFT_10381 [Phialemonium thermophilum]|uniref:WSC domain-containing protein n=1 Tax=Phialemonium thermophilum TaxID=223376 RepID=A0ABR3VX27_9PEZI